MEFFNDLKKNITGTAKDVRKKSEDLVEITKLSVSIGSDEEKLKKLLYELGAEIYSSYCEKPEESYCTKKCLEIARLEETIKKNKERVLALRGSAECKACGAVVDVDANFCHKCGAPVDKVIVASDEEDAEGYTSLEQEEP